MSTPCKTRTVLSGYTELSYHVLCLSTNVLILTAFALSFRISARKPGGGYALSGCAWSGCAQIADNRASIMCWQYSADNK